MRRLTPWLVTLALCLHAFSAHAADVVLNEYNAVSSDRFLDGGDSADFHWGSIQGNGGNWFELAVVGDHVDMRGWQLAWTENEPVDDEGNTAAGIITLSDDELWSDLRSGSILTFVETIDAGLPGEGNDSSTDTSYDPFNDDWWINISTQQEQGRGADGLVSSTTNDGSPGDFSVGNDDWTLTILNSAGDTVFGPAGEGATDWAGDGVGSSEGGSLEGPLGTDEAPLTLESWTSITPASDLYDDTGSTSFGAPNMSYNNVDFVFTLEQDFSVLRDRVLGPVVGDGDFNDDGSIDAADIDALTQAVRDGIQDLAFDVNLDGTVSSDDRTAWVEQVKMTYLGDANLDGEFSSADLVAVLGAGEYEDDVDGNSTWATGDWNGDGDFTTSDFVTALGGGGYEQGPRAAVAAAVPEPSTGVLALLSLLSLVGVRRRY